MSFLPQNRVFGPAMTVVLFLIASPPAHAYLDPSTGSMIVSAIIGIFASIALAVKTYWYKLKSLFRGRERSRPEAAEDRSGES